MLLTLQPYLIVVYVVTICKAEKSWYKDHHKKRQDYNNDDLYSTNYKGGYQRLKTPGQATNPNLDMYFPSRINWWTSNGQNYGHLNVMPILSEHSDVAPLPSTLYQPSEGRDAIGNVNDFTVLDSDTMLGNGNDDIIGSYNLDVGPLSSEQRDAVQQRILLGLSDKHLPYVTIANVQARQQEQQRQIDLQKNQFHLPLRGRFQTRPDTAEMLQGSNKFSVDDVDDDIGEKEQLQEQQLQTQPNDEAQQQQQGEKPNQQQDANKEPDTVDRLSPTIFDMNPTCPRGYKRMGKFCISKAHN